MFLRPNLGIGQTLESAPRRTTESWFWWMNNTKNGLFHKSLSVCAGPHHPSDVQISQSRPSLLMFLCQSLSLTWLFGRNHDDEECHLSWQRQYRDWGDQGVLWKSETMWLCSLKDTKSSDFIHTSVNYHCKGPLELLAELFKKHFFIYLYFCVSPWGQGHSWSPSVLNRLCTAQLSEEHSYCIIIDLWIYYNHVPAVHKVSWGRLLGTYIYRIT